MKIILIGGWGYIGLNLIRQLKNHEIVVIDPHYPTDAEREFLSEQIDCIEHVICGVPPDSSATLTSYPIYVMYDADVVVSLAGQLGSAASVKDLWASFNESMVPHVWLLDLLAKRGLKPLVVFPSSDLTYCYPPRCDYAANKLCIEDKLRIAHKVHGIPYVALRMATGYGPMQRRNSVVNLYVKLGLEGKNIPVWGDGLNRQAFIYADDMAKAFKMACEGRIRTGVYPLVGHVSRIGEIAATVSRLVGGKVVYEPYPSNAEKVNVGDLPIFGNPPKFEPEVGLEEGILKTAEWMRR